MLGMPGDVDEQPASRRASFHVSCVWIAGGRVEVERTEKDDAGDDQEHEDVVVAEERY